MATAKRIASSIDQVNQCMTQQDRARQSGEFQVLGRLYSIETAAGRIQLEIERPVHKQGPGIAQQLDETGEPSGELIFITPWIELPQLPGYSEKFCPKCLVTCDICGGTGKQTCGLCGGVGSVKAGEKPCKCVLMRKCSCIPVGSAVEEGTGRYSSAVYSSAAKPDPLCGLCLGKGEVGRPDPDCTICGGYGAIPTRNECPSCKLQRVADCATCRGTGMRPSGKKGNDPCPNCRGTLRDGKWQAQDIAKVIVGRMGGCLVIGPVLRLVIVPPPSNLAADRFSSRFQVGDSPRGGEFLRIKPGDSGTDLYILLPTIVRKGQPMFAYCYGVKQS